MTKRQREQVVELLRCAGGRLGSAMPFSSTVALLGVSPTIENLAYDAWRAEYNSAKRDRRYGAMAPLGWSVSPHLTLLEAAARVEEGSWP